MPTLNEIMDKIGASILLSYSGLVVSCVTRDGIGFVLSKLLFISPCNRDTINTIPKSPLFAVCSFMKKHHCLVQSRYARSELLERSNHFEHVQNFYSGRSVLLEIKEHNIIVLNKPIMGSQ